ncbi:hypothetical protein D1BOALGB6SA_5538 [Olavius sp. associated proteobacterium Delta 1]|nr:hypothetical protein D1BOALGB6SA_5538 [Olavius sp. associated proteobacterium Delta 1]
MLTAMPSNSDVPTIRNYDAAGIYNWGEFHKLKTPQGSTVTGAAHRQKFPPKPPGDYQAEITIRTTA